jgi:tRNA (cmo5U34)-methyltransferase
MMVCHAKGLNMDLAEHQQMLEYLRIAEQSKYRFEDIKARFEAEPATSYGEHMDRWIPDFEYAHRLLLDSITIHLPNSATAVELGAGTGRVSQRMLDAFPDLRLSLVDISANMLSAAQTRLAQYAPRCQFVVRDIFEEGFNFPANSVDCVVSVFAICHAQDVPVYRQLYGRIQRWLKPGGYFVCYDHVRGDTLALTALNAMWWHRLLAAGQTPDEAREGIVSTYQEDSPLSLRQHLGLLSAAGFSAADVLYKRDIFAIYASVK